MSLLAVNLGLPKSGTTTLARALRLSGLRTADFRIRARQTEDPDLVGSYVAELIYRGLYGSGDPAALLPGFQAISEMSLLAAGRSLWPQTDYAVIAAFRARHPGVRFLASRRDAFEMSQSMLAWSDMGLARLPKADVPGLPAGFGETTRERMHWIEAHYAHLRALFAGDPDFLEYDVADPEAPGKIGAFLGRDLPWWGRANSNPVRRAEAGS